MIKPLSYHVGDSIKYKNDFGFEIGLRVNAYELIHETEFDCIQTGDASCGCRWCASIQEFTAYTKDVPWPSIDSNKLTLYNRSFYDEGNFVLWDIRYSLFDAGKNGHSNSSKFPLSDDFFESYELGGIKYADVYIVDDTSEIISKVYISLEKGIIGFEETETPSIFYLTE